MILWQMGKESLLKNWEKVQNMMVISILRSREAMETKNKRLDRGPRVGTEN
jgi:hypothetical protein